MEFSVTLLLSCSKSDRTDYAKRFDHALNLSNLEEMLQQTSPALLTILRLKSRIIRSFSFTSAF